MAALSNAIESGAGQEDACIRRMQDIKNGGWDLFLRIMEDGSMAITAVTVSAGVSSRSGIQTFMTLRI